MKYPQCEGVAEHLYWDWRAWEAHLEWEQEQTYQLQQEVEQEWYSQYGDSMQEVYDNMALQQH